MDYLSILQKGQDILGMLVMVMTGLIGIALMVPGEQPEKFLQGILDFLKKFSKK